MKKGFTLIELICVIAILGLISLIAIPTINNMIQKSKEETYNKQVLNIEKSARNYMSQNSLELPGQTAGACCISIEKMQTTGFLSEEDIKNPLYKSGSTIDKEKNAKFIGGVNIKYNDNKYIYTYTTTCSPAC